jgi:hypothetical protein
VTLGRRSVQREDQLGEAVAGLHRHRIVARCDEEARGGGAADEARGGADWPPAEPASTSSKRRSSGAANSAGSAGVTWRRAEEFAAAAARYVVPACPMHEPVAKPRSRRSVIAFFPSRLSGAK